MTTVSIDVEGKEQHRTTHLACDARSTSVMDLVSLIRGGCLSRAMAFGARVQVSIDGRASWAFVDCYDLLARIWLAAPLLALVGCERNFKCL